MSATLRTGVRTWPGTRPSRWIRSRRGEFRTTLHEALFGALRDAPDYWGRLVVERRGSPEKELDYLLATPDVRVGALSFAHDTTPPHLDSGSALPMSALDRAAAAASAVEAGLGAGEAVDLHVDPDLPSRRSRAGHIWVRRRLVADDHGNHLYDVLDTEDRWLGPIPVPTAIGTIREIGSDSIAAVRSDDLGVQSITVLGLRTGG